MVKTREEYDRQFERLAKAIAALKSDGCYLHAIARAYYQVHLTASYAAYKRGARIERSDRHSGTTLYQSDYSHNEMPDLVHALYEGQRHGRVIPGSGSGITKTKMAPSEAARRADQLQRDRKDADYGPTLVAEPYTAPQADERLEWANLLVEDLRRLI